MGRVTPLLLVGSVLFLGPPLDVIAQTGTTTRVSVASGGAQANLGSRYAIVSADGRYVAFVSGATNLVAGDTNARADVFVHDRLTGTTTRVSVASNGAQASQGVSAASPGISADGRFVAFTSGSADLVAGDVNGRVDVFVHDRQTGETALVSVADGGAQANGDSYGASISADGRYVAFGSGATNLVPGDANGEWDVFVRDRLEGTTTRVSVATGGGEANDNCALGVISADGRYVAFDCYATNLAAGDNNDDDDVFVHDRLTGTTTRVSVATGGAGANLGNTLGLSISASGRYVAFDSRATNLVPGDTNGKWDIFVHDRQTGTTTRASVSSAGAQADDDSFRPAISADGRAVAFESDATNLVPGDVNAIGDVFVHWATGATRRASVSTAGEQGYHASVYASISADGRAVAFESDATNLVPGDTNAVWDIFVRDLGPVRLNLPAGDYDGDGKADLAVFRPSGGAWYLTSSATGAPRGVLWGEGSDVPVPADYDGDGTTDVAVFRPGNGTWQVAQSSGGSAGIVWGAAGDVPAPGDYDGDGHADAAVFRPETGAWYVRKSAGGSLGLVWGTTGDEPVPADYDGDGKTDVAVFRGSNHAWYVVKSSTGTAIGFIWGDVGDIPVVADYDGDGKADVGVFRGSNHAWYIIRSTTGTAVGFLWGDSGDVPVFGDYDGDLKADVTVFRPSTGAWYIMKSTGGAVGLFWGTAGDLPV